ncbi:MAG: hypothetical protein JXA30_16220 [Deltaproteobacteria bacterium]|nr:hypothetical protein [Deltaproteobacteria bacterium]
MKTVNKLSGSDNRNPSYLCGLLFALLFFIAAEACFSGCSAESPNQPTGFAGSGGVVAETGGIAGSVSGGSSASGSGGSNAITGGVGGVFDSGIADGSSDGSSATLTGGTGAASGAGGTGGSAASGGTGGSAGSPPAGSCAMSTDRVRVTEVDVGSTVLTGEDEYAMNMLAISPIPSGGSRLAWLSGDGKVHIAQLDANDQVTGTPVALPAHDFSDIFADDRGGVVLLTRDAQGGGNLNCGNINNLCGNAASYPTDYACYDMYLVRFDGVAETWATKLTDSSASRPPYGTSPTDSNRTTFVWHWYGHHGRIVSDGSRWAAYYGVSISGSSQVLTMSGCAQADSTLAVGIDIHQGDQMRIVDANGTMQQLEGFQLGCSHSYYERIVWDPAANKFVPICETDRDNTLSFAPRGPAIFAIDMQRSYPANYSNLGNIVLGTNGGYWVALSKSRDATAGMADVHLLHFTTGTPDKDIIISNDPTLNCRAAHLGKYGSSRLVAAWETSASANDYTAWTTDRKFYIQTYSGSTGEAEGGPLQLEIKGNKYYEFRDFPDGSVAYPAAGSSATKIKVVRVLPCN